MTTTPHCRNRQGVWSTTNVDADSSADSDDFAVRQTRGSIWFPRVPCDSDTTGMFVLPVKAKVQVVHLSQSNLEQGVAFMLQGDSEYPDTWHILTFGVLEGLPFSLVPIGK
jgi:hypothetical protein